MLHNSINISGLNEKKEMNEKNQKKKKIIVINNFFCENNIFICDKIRVSIPTCSDKFEILTSAISFFTPNKEKERNKGKDLYLLEYENNEDEMIDFFEYLSAIKTNPKKYIFTIITTYQKLLKHILLLQKTNIVHFNINYDTICLKKKTEQVLIRDWTNAIITSCKSHLENQSYITKKNDDILTNSPLEIYVLVHMNKYNLETLNVSSIEIICKTYIDNPYLSFITTTFKHKLYLNCVVFLTPLIDMTREKIIDELMKYSHTWDNYALSIIYLHIIASFKHNCVFFRDFFRLLHKNLLIKTGITETIDAFDSLFYKHTEWINVF
jgi:hypothetical protein